MADLFELGFRIDTTPLNSAKTAADAAASSISKVGDAEERAAKQSRASADATKQAADAKRQAAQGAGALGESLGGLTGKISVSAQQIQALAAALGQGGGSGLMGAMAAARGAMTAFTAGAGGVATAMGATVAAVGALGYAYYKLNEPLAAAQDKFALMEARLKNALGSTYAARDALDQLQRMAHTTGLGFDASAQAFLRFARANDTLGASRDQLLQFTETIQKLGAVSGAGLGETQSALIQLGQALSSGRLQGDELRSIGENAPAILKAIADGLGRTTGEIRAMGAAGELSTQKIFEAILKATEKARKEFASLPDTGDRANQRVADAWDRLLATLGEKWNSSGFVRGVRNFFAELIANTEKSLRGPSAQEQVGIAANRLIGGGSSTRFAYNQATATLRDPNATEDAKKAAQEQIDALLQGRIDRLGQGNPLVQQYLEARRALENKAVEAEADAERQAQGTRTATINTGLTTGREYDDFETKLKSFREAREKIQAAIAQARQSIATGYTSGGSSEEADLARTALPTLERQLAALEGQARSAAPALAKLREETDDFIRAFERGGGGGGTSLIEQAMAALKAAEARQGVGRAGSESAYMSQFADRRTVELVGQTREIERQITQQAALTNVVGQTAEELKAVEDAQRRANLEFQFLGGPNSPARQYPLLVDGVNALIDAQNRLAAATKETARQEALYQEGVAQRIIAAQRGSVGLGGYAMREREADIRRRETNRTTPGLGEEQYRTFIEREGLSADQRLEEQSRATATAQRTIGMNARQRALDEAAERQRRVLDETPAGPQRDRIISLIEQEANAKLEDGYKQQDRSLQAQLKTIQERNKYVYATTEEMRVQQAVIERRIALEQEGAPEEVIERQTQITEEIERQTIAYEKQRKNVEDLFSIIDSGASATKSVFINTFEEAFRTGKLNAKSFFDGMSQMLNKVAAEFLYEMAIKPFVVMAANAAKAGLSNALPALFGGGGATGGAAPNSALNSYGVPAVAANGLAFDYGGIQKFAAGGIVSSPTLFAFANGGRLGLMGEAGPEAIMPLRRGADGKLGVAGGGGGGDVMVVVNDYRTKGGEQVGIEQSMGPDGKRMISVLIRDEVRRAFRNGEMDRDMSNNFGATRPVMRK